MQLEVEEQQRREKLLQAVQAYRRCVDHLGGESKIMDRRKKKKDSPTTRRVLLEAASCLLNAACICVRLEDAAQARELCETALSLDEENPHGALFTAQALRK